MTDALYRMLLQFGVLGKFFPSFDASLLSIGNDDNSYIFKSYRSTAVKDTYYVLSSQ